MRGKRHGGIMVEEVKNKPEHALEWTGERIIPEAGRYMFRRHLEAYQFSMKFCWGKAVLDAGCGEGYGSCLLSETGSEVIGIDISEEAIRHAREKYVRENLGYQVMDAAGMGFADNSFDVVVSFQVIEHLNNADKFLKEVRRVLRKDGWAIISTPNKALCDDSPVGEYHVKEYRYNEFMDLLNTHFGKAEYYGIRLKGGDAMKMRLLDFMLTLDVFGIRRLFPSGFRDKMQAAIEKTFSFDITGKSLESALDIVGVCKKD